MIAAYIDEIIMFCAGLWMTSVGFGYVQLSGNPATRSPWVTTLSGHFKWMGPPIARHCGRSGNSLLGHDVFRSDRPKDMNVIPKI